MQYDENIIDGTGCRFCGRCGRSGTSECVDRINCDGGAVFNDGTGDKNEMTGGHGDSPLQNERRG